MLGTVVRINEIPHRIKQNIDESRGKISIPLSINKSEELEDEGARIYARDKIKTVISPKLKTWKNIRIIKGSEEGKRKGPMI